MVYAGTAVTYGRGRALIVATGMQSELGKIARRSSAFNFWGLHQAELGEQARGGLAESMGRPIHPHHTAARIDDGDLGRDMYYRRRDDLRLPVELVAGEPRVPVDAHVLALLDRVDQDVADVMEDWSLGKTRRGPSRPPPRWPIECV